MSTLISRPATEDDLSIVKEIVDSNLLSLNPREKRIGDSEALNFIRGFVDPAITRLTKFSKEDDWKSFITLNPDASRSRFYLDVYTRPGASTLHDSFELAIQLARETNPDFQLWLGVQSNDLEYKNLLHQKGFDLLRRYWTLEMELPSNLKPRLPVGLIREIDPTIESEMRSFHAVNQDSFSKHFGFMPRAYEEWRELVLRDREEVNLRVWLISVDGEDVGFLDCSDELIHEDAGYVAGLGVRLAFHGRGLGESLLNHAIQTYSALGRKKLCLNVDAGNESGALRLYEKVGMKPFSEWHQYENVNWSSQTA